jgi:hypothetical protein
VTTQALQLVNRLPASVRSVIVPMVESGEIDVPQLRSLVRAHQHQERVTHRPHETVYETTDTTIEIYHFED